MCFCITCGDKFCTDHQKVIILNIVECKALYVTAWLTRIVLIQIYDGYTNCEGVEHKFMFIFKKINSIKSYH